MHKSATKGNKPQILQMAYLITTTLGHLRDSEQVLM